ncbi:hypothetical protein BX600DRAFT_77748 [Xylariales sp. PMI_506]|nr:hypothetical protein BX600DRAFT_77748 [Xylariales sp. PMI_506]
MSPARGGEGRGRARAPCFAIVLQLLHARASELGSVASISSGRSLIALFGSCSTFYAGCDTIISCRWGEGKPKACRKCVQASRS